MKDARPISKEAFAVIGIAGEGPANDISWIPPLWAAANARFSEIEGIVRKNEQGAPLGCWGAMNDVSERNRRWGDTGKYMAGCEADVDVIPPEGWTKWIIPKQNYLVAECTMDTYGEVFGRITGDKDIEIIATVHERYPEPGNPNKVELYFPIA